METKKVAKIAKRVVLGKNKPTPILRFLCWFSIVWDTLIGLYMAVSGFLFYFDTQSVSSDSVLKEFTQTFCFTYAGLHLISLFSVVLMYRLKRNGFIIYTMANVAMVVSAFIFLDSMKADYLYMSFTLVMIGLFATQLKKLS